MRADMSSRTRPAGWCGGAGAAKARALGGVGTRRGAARRRAAGGARRAQGLATAVVFRGRSCPSVAERPPGGGQENL
jgi:hypothetical protein